MEINDALVAIGGVVIGGAISLANTWLTGKQNATQKQAEFQNSRIIEQDKLFYADRNKAIKDLIDCANSILMASRSVGNLAGAFSSLDEHFFNYQQEYNDSLKVFESKLEDCRACSKQLHYTNNNIEENYEKLIMQSSNMLTYGKVLKQYIQEGSEGDSYSRAGTVESIRDCFNGGIAGGREVLQSESIKYLAEGLIKDLGQMLRNPTLPNGS